ncbi:MAG: hypothetical protein WCF94_04350 [bacterium]
MEAKNNFENLKTSIKSNWGGLRSGSGRKPRPQYEARELFNLVIDHEWERILKAVLTRVYKGDREMIKWVVEQRMGKVPNVAISDDREAFLSPCEPRVDDNGIDIMEIAKGVSDALKKHKLE